MIRDVDFDFDFVSFVLEVASVWRFRLAFGFVAYRAGVARQGNA